MFGYIRPFKPQLRICEFEAYKAVYCGLCGMLGRRFGAPARLTLSYDFVFLAMLCCAATGDEPSLSVGRCHVNPLKKQLCCGDSEALRFSADVAALTLYQKLADNLRDSGLLARAGWSLLMPAARAARKRAAAAYPEADRILEDMTRRQIAVEHERPASLDENCEPTAAAMAALFALISAEGPDRRVLERLGYLIGRFIYMCDALDDIEADEKRGRYNPLLLRETNRALTLRQAKESLYMTIGEAAKAYGLFAPRVFRPILDNIVELGLRASVDEILKKKEKSDGRSL